MRQLAMLLLAAALVAPAGTRTVAGSAPATVAPAQPAKPRAQPKRRGVRSWLRRIAALEPELAMRLSGWGIPEEEGRVRGDHPR